MGTERRSRPPRGRALALLVAISGGASSAPPAGIAAQEPRPSLFDEDTTLRLTVVTDLRGLLGDRDEDSEYRDARILVHGTDSSALDLPARVQTRGNFRLQRRNCGFPPIRVNFPSDSLEGTPFDGENRLKMVTHCRDREDFEQNVLEEFLAYRILNRLTDRSFRVRLARVTYDDSRGGRDPVTRYAFFIEDEDRMAERLGGEIMALEVLHPFQADGPHATLIELFQYMIGNTDFSLVQFHNAVLVRRPDGTLLPVPYDFDWSGLVDAPYATPDPRLRLSSVRQRQYRGFCRPDVRFSEVVDLVRSRREAVLATVDEIEGMSDDNRERDLSYLSDFFETLDDERSTDRQIVRFCRRL